MRAAQVEFVYIAELVYIEELRRKEPGKKLKLNL